ncbi:adenylate/guanylate cyclase domain-containing protein [Tenggerimyces flavus]|uniref:AAA family ATPase n=1 Tax=Tenggerimyces flavus TaxID=1708749 RepID=A0ABV7YJR5_9ACTN|nr:adenylate/guanylate cyclase domain-containing protein [Tenggerimyces flavus]MBM7789690.1 class 3 adenylate cyclase/tetratricopeptide (TPR) repeat protein [Tenggerimyces flavus]
MPLCPGCGQDNPSLARFCMSCGGFLPSPGPAPPGARKTVTVVFCDVVGSTAMGELLDPESVREVMTRYFRASRAAVEHHGGTVEKFIGDAVMAVFGVPLLHEDDALRAVRAANGIRDAVAELNAEIKQRWNVELRVRIGVNTGEVVVGDPNAGEALVVGDAVNVAARLEQAAGAGQIFLGTDTYALVRDHVDAPPTKPLALKGKQAPVRAYDLLSVTLGPTSISVRSDTPLVGRAEELATIRSAFDRARAARECALFTVRGTAGVGKSRLAREFEARLGDSTLVLHAHCPPYGDGLTFWPIAELVKEACSISDADSPEASRAKIDELLASADDGPLVAERVAAVAGLGGKPTAIRETFWAIRRLLERLGRDRPVVLVVDDLHWAESTFLDLIEYLAGWSRGVALFLLCLTRPELADARPSWAAGTSNAASLALVPLDDGDSEELMSVLLDGRRLGPETTRRIAESAGGNPLFMEEMLRMLEDDGLLLHGNLATVVGDLATVEVPASIHALLGARLDRLSEEERAVLRCASIVGRVFWWGAVATLAPEAARPRLASHLQTLVRKELIRPDTSTFAGEDAFRFHHVVVQMAAYRGTPKELRATLHERFGEWYEQMTGGEGPDVDEVLGFHLEQAHRYRYELGLATGDAEIGVRAAGHLSTAGRHAFAQGAMSSAADLLSRSVDLLPTDHVERRALLPDLAEAWSQEGDLARAETIVAEAAAVADRTGDRGLGAHIQVVRLLLLESTDPKQLAAEADQIGGLIETLSELGDEVGLARAYRLLGHVHWARSRFADAGSAFERGLEHARRSGSRWDESEALGQYLGAAVHGPSTAAEVARRSEAFLASSPGIGVGQAQALRSLATSRAMDGRFDEARDLVARSRSMLTELRLRMHEAFIGGTLGSIELMAGDPVAAERAFRTAYDATVELGEQGFLSTVAAQLAQALVAQGKLDDAHVLVQLSKDIGAEDDLATQVLWRTAQAGILAARGATEEAITLVRAALDLAEQTDDIAMIADTLDDLGRLLQPAGRGDEARSVLQRAHALYEAKGNVVGAWTTTQGLERLTAEAQL